MVVRNSTTLMSARRAALLIALCLQLFSLVRPARGTARRTTYFEDTACGVEVFGEYVFSARAIDSQGNVSEAEFNVCYPRGSTGAITTCNPEDGSTVVETYLDTECSQPLYNTSTAPECVNLFDQGEPSPPGGAGSSRSDCTDTIASEPVVPETFNLVGSPYSDNQCSTRTGGEHVVPGSAFGVGSGVCDKSFLSRGRLYALSKCMSDGSVFSQVFSGDDDTCSGDMLLESVVFPATSEGGGICTLGKIGDGYEYYRLTACTTEEATDGTPMPPTPAPTVGNGDDDDWYSYGPEPAPIDYEGDGDDEDLRESTDDDDTEHGDDRDGRGRNDDASTSTSDTDDDGEGGSHPPHREDDDRGSSEDDDNGANPSGGRDEDNDGDGGGLNEDGVFALVFGITVSVAICVFSAVLAFAGRERDAKVGPKA